MPEDSLSSSLIPDESVRSQLDRVLASRHFAQSSRLRRFLVFVVEAALNGRSEEIKETTIGVTVYDRPASYDPKVDPIVRVEARRLRRKLAGYYEEEGLNDSVFIDMPQGSYVPCFSFLRKPEKTILGETANDDDFHGHTDKTSTPEISGSISRAALNLQSDPSDSDPPVDIPPVIIPPRRARVRWSIWLRFSPLFLLLPALLVALSYRSGSTKFNPLSMVTHEWERVSLTDYPGYQLTPAFSPDGRSIAFSWNGQGLSSDLYTRSVNDGEPKRLTQDFGHDVYPSWSPDSSHIAYLHIGLDRLEVRVIPSVGGAFKTIVSEINQSEWGRDAATIPDNIAPIWTADGKGLIFPSTLGGEGRCLELVSLDGHAHTQLTFPPENAFDSAPALSSDGNTLAFARYTSSLSFDLMTLDLRNNFLRNIAQGLPSVKSLTWGPDNSLIFTGAYSGDPPTIWRISSHGGTPTRLNLQLVRAINPAFSPVTGMLAFSEWKTQVGLHIRQIPQDLPVSKPEPYAFQQAVDGQYSPDGRNIAFFSHHSTKWQLWVADSSGEHAHKLPGVEDGNMDSFSWSPDGKWLAFDHNTKNGLQVFLVPAAGGDPKELGPINQPKHYPSWSSDGRWIYYSALHGESTQLWRSNISDGRVELIAAMPVFESAEDEAGHYIYFASTGAGIWRVPSDGGTPEKVPELASVLPSRSWTIRHNALFFVDTRESALTLTRFDLDSHEMKVLPVHLSDMSFGTLGHGLSISPDESKCIYTRDEGTGSILDAIKNFK